ncbi:hypothetical protein D6D02_01904, partial [Aureobasidium pullulans]
SIGASLLLLRQAIDTGPSLCLLSTHLVISDLRVSFAPSGLFIANRSRLILFWLPLGLTGTLEDLVEKLVKKRQMGGMYVPSLITSSKAKNHVLSPSPPALLHPTFLQAMPSAPLRSCSPSCASAARTTSPLRRWCDACHEPGMRKNCWCGSHGCKNVPAILTPYLNDDIRAKDALLLALRPPPHVLAEFHNRCRACSNSSTERVGDVEVPRVFTRNMTSDELLRREQLIEQQRNRRALEDSAADCAERRSGRRGAGGGGSARRPARRSGPADRSPMELDSDDLERRRTMSILPVSAGL